MAAAHGHGRGGRKQDTGNRDQVPRSQRALRPLRFWGPNPWLFGAGQHNATPLQSHKVIPGVLESPSLAVGALRTQSASALNKSGVLGSLPWLFVMHDQARSGRSQTGSRTGSRGQTGWRPPAGSLHPAGNRPGHYGHTCAPAHRGVAASQQPRPRCGYRGCVRGTQGSHSSIRTPWPATAWQRHHHGRGGRTCDRGKIARGAKYGARPQG